MYRNDYVLGLSACRGVMIMIHRTVHSEEIAINSPLQVVAARVRSPVLSCPLTVCCLYISHDRKLTKDEIYNIKRQLPRPYIICSDMNAHNTIWGGSKIDSNGIQVEKFLLENDVCLLNTNEATHFNSSNGTFSAIDLTLASRSIMPDLKWSVHDDLCNSDHFPILIQFWNKNLSNQSSRDIWIFKRADWDKYRNNISFDCKIKGMSDIDKCLELFNEDVLSAAKVAIPVLKTSRVKRLVPWWTEEVKNAVHEKKNAFKILRRNPTPANLIEFKKCRAKARRTLLTAQKKSWSDFVSSIDKPLTIGDMWSQLRRVKGKKPYNPIAALNNDQNQITTDKDEMSEILAKYYVSNSADSVYEEDFVRYKHQVEPLLLPPSNTEAECYNLPFSYNELIATFKSCRSHAPGVDGVCYQMIMQLPQCALEKLLEIFNFIWLNGVFPKVWKTALIVPILKPKKNALIAENYRPISLLSCSNKILEKMISKRLKWLVENKKIIDPYQSGNRWKRSTMDNLVLLEHEIATAFQINENVVAIFLDITKFFDRVSKASVLDKLIKFNIGGPMFMYINNFLSSPQISVKIENVRSTIHKLENSIRQGSSLSGDLCNIATSDLPHYIPTVVSHGMFVDDLAIFMRGKDIDHIQETLQITLNKLMSWSKTNGLNFSPEKTFAINFSKKRNQINPRLHFQNHIIQFKDTTKYLGLNLDSRLTWKFHIEQTKSKSLKALNVMKILSNRNWGLRRETLRRLYYSFVLPILDYGSILYSSASEPTLKKLNVVHHTGVRLISGAFRTSPIVSILAESGTPPLPVRRNILALNYICNVSRNTANPAHTVLFHKGPRITCSKYNKPLRSRVEDFSGVSELNVNSIAKYYVNHAPWQVEVPRIDHLVTSPKKNLSNQDVVQHFLKFKDQHKFDTLCFTDGSKTIDHTGAAYIIRDEVCRIKLNPVCSIFTAELFAIEKCLEKIKDLIRSELNIQNFIICSDSKSSLQALQNVYHASPLVCNIISTIQDIRELGTRVSFLWIPSHLGIRENEKVDHAARHCNDVPITKVCISDDFKIRFRKIQLDEWSKSWSDNIATGQKLKKIKPDTRRWKSSMRWKRAEEIVICRLRIGHCLATHKFLLDRQDPPSCHLCNHLPLTIEHWFLHCPALDNFRRKHKLDNSMKLILRDNNDVIDKCLRFLYHSKLFSLI
ncbi:hypothetical protein M8J77_022246 [Diaphorina citri]|nr:hypothetical protein M8J77_022246 [Diaphorina citri]